MNVIKVPGINKKHRVLMYALSSCAWCKRAKRFLRDHNIEYEYIDLDLCSREEREKIRSDILSRRGRLSYPTIIVDDTILITGYNEDRIRKVLEI
ncbi:glutaredoxin family protein [Candidatus Bathyarchaeota archaeon]|jgi:glutaredoxin|nr:glutaredoxin family protein [Candidatus Bathyarchaeota archaeon]